MYSLTEFIEIEEVYNDDNLDGIDAIERDMDLQDDFLLQVEEDDTMLLDDEFDDLPF